MSSLSRKVHLEVPFKEKDAAKKAGLLWDTKVKKWYATAYRGQGVWLGSMSQLHWNTTDALKDKRNHGSKEHKARIMHILSTRGVR